MSYETRLFLGVSVVVIATLTMSIKLEKAYWPTRRDLPQDELDTVKSMETSGIYVSEFDGFGCDFRHRGRITIVKATSDSGFHVTEFELLQPGTMPNGMSVDLPEDRLDGLVGDLSELTHLRRIVLPGASPTQVATLQKRLPECEINEFARRPSVFRR